MPTLALARELAHAIVEVAAGNGLRAAALLTDMDQVLGRTAGNAVEVIEAIDALTGDGCEPRLREVTTALSAELLVLGGLHGELAAARVAAAHALDSGAAAERFAAMVAELGGPGDLLEDPWRHLPSTPLSGAVYPQEPGVVAAIDVRALGIAVVGLGGGRARETDPVDHAVGLTDVAALGERVEEGGRPFAIVQAHDEESLERAADAVVAAFTLGDAPAPPRPPVIEVQRTGHDATKASWR
jgi:thymidine phosphorylase